MNLFPLLVLYAIGKMGKGSAPSWPTPRHPPPRRAHRTHHAAAVPSPAPAAEPAHAAEPAPGDPPAVAPHPAAPHAAPVHHRRRRRRVAHSMAYGGGAPPAPADVPPTAVAPVVPLRTSEPMPEPAAASAPEPFAVSIATIQRILVGLGWRGHGTTHGALQPELTDGLWGPVTRDDWQTSAHTHGVDPTIERLGPETAHVDPDAYAALRSLAAQRGAVVGGRRRRRLRIP